MPRRRFACRARRSLVPTVLLLLSVGAVLPASAAPTPRGELLVGFRAGVAPGAQEAVLREAGAVSRGRFDRIRLRVVAAANPEAAARRLARDPRVRYVEPNGVVRLAAPDDPDDPRFGELWGLRNTGQVVGWWPGVPDADIDAPEAWARSTGAGVVVAVTDTGVDLAHPDLAANAAANPGEVPGNGRDDDGNGYVDDVHGWDFVDGDNVADDPHGHGTHVAGTIAAVAGNRVGVAGVAPAAKLLPLRMLGADGTGSTAGAVAAVLYAAESGVDVLNASWGDTDDSQALRDAVAAADAAGVLVVAAAGNAATDTDASPHYPSGIDAPNVLSVAATDNRDGPAYFSNVGVRSVDLGAPGVAILSTWPNGGYRFLDGTSMAAPHVAGAAALAKAAFPSATAVGLKALLLRTVDPLASLAGRTATGGRLDAAAAVACSGPRVWLESPSPGGEPAVGETVAVRALAAACGGSATPTVTASAAGSPVPLTARGDGVFTGSFTVTAAGSLPVTVTASAGGATDSRSVSLLVSPGFEAVVGGPPVTVATTVAHQNAKAFFTGSAGRRVSVRVDAVAMAGVKVSLVAPDGAVLVAPVYAGPAGGFLEPATLPVDGRYAVVVDPQGATTGSVRLTLHDVPPDPTVATSPGGAPTTVSLPVPGQNGHLTFTGTAGQAVSVAVGGVTLGSARVSLVGPDGAPLAYPAYVGPTGGFVEPQVLPATGPYEVLLDPYGAATGSATVTLHEVPPDATAPATVGGPARSVATTVPGQNARVTFAAAAGARLSVRLSSVTLSGARATLLAPDGSALVGGLYVGPSGGFVEPLTLPSTGTYAVALDPIGATTGSIAVTLYAVPPDVQATATLGGTAVTVATSVPGQNARIRFAGRAGARLALQLSSVSFGGAYVSVRAPDGSTFLAATYAGPSGTFVEPRELTVDGTYEVLLDPVGAAVGSAAVKLLDVPPDVPVDATVGGSPLAVTAAMPGQNPAVAFDASAGRTVTVTLSGVTVVQGRASVLAPDGTVALAPLWFFTSGKTFAFTPAAAGRYVLVLDPYGTAVGSITVTLR